MARQVVCRSEELPPGERKTVRLGGRSIGVLNVEGRLYALRDSCPHQGAPLCAGTVGGTLVPSEPHQYEYGLEGRIVRCPWHGLEFDLTTGRSLTHPEGMRVKVYPVTIEEGLVVLDA